jgi:pimeloyl-ACP methyl ester carboxylesterase
MACTNNNSYAPNGLGAVTIVVLRQLLGCRASFVSPPRARTGCDHAETVNSARGCLSTCPDVFIGTHRSEPRAPQLPPLPRGHCPIRIAWGRRDRLTPYARLEKTPRTSFPGVEITVLSQVGHTPMWDNPGLVVSTIRPLTARVDAGTGE